MILKRLLLSRMELVKVILAKVDLVLHTVPLGMLNTTAYLVHAVVQLLLESFRQGLWSCQTVLADSGLFLLLQPLTVKLTLANVAKDELRHFWQADFHFDLV